MNSKKFWFVAIAGHILERYEVTLFGYFAATLAPIFFPNQNHVVSTLLSLSTFAAGYIMRPLGGIIFGYVGDKIGRKNALLNSILCVTFPTLLIGLLPSYAQIGILAPLALVGCRLFQGLCVGGEYSGAAIYFFEHTQPRYRGIAGGIMSATAFFGAALGAFVGFLSTYLLPPNWNWRIPFLLGATLSLGIYVMRRRMIETPLFEQIKQKNAITKNPFLDVLKHEKVTLFCAFLIGSQGHIVLYMTTLYMNTILIEPLALASFQMFMLNTGILILWCIFILFFGMLSDKINKAFLIIFISMLISVSAYPLFLFLKHNFSLMHLLGVEIILSFLGSGLFAVSASYLPSLFKTQKRYTGVALGQTLGQAILGGTTPLITVYLSTHIGVMNAPVVLLLFSGLFGLTAVTLLTHSSKPKPTERLELAYEN